MSILLESPIYYKIGPSNSQQLPLRALQLYIAKGDTRSLERCRAGLIVKLFFRKPTTPGLQVEKSYLLWRVMFVLLTCFGPFGALV